MNEWWNKPIRAFLDDAASSEPTPGGGSIAALAAALGASMGSMASSLTTGDKYAAVRETMLAAAREMKTAIDRCETIMQQDIDVFRHYMSVLKLPRATEEEKSARRQAIGEAARNAAEVPLELMELCRGLLAILDAESARINPHVISDWGIAALMLEAAAQSAWLTAEINLPSIPDPSEAAAMRKRGEAASAECARLKQAVVAAARAKV